MTWRVIFREILENLLSLRFVLSLVLVICLFAASGFVFVVKLAEQMEDYWAETNKNLSALREECSGALYKAAFYKQTIWRKPKPLSFCTEGFEKSLPNCFITDAFTRDLPQVKGRGNFALPHFSDIDWVFIHFHGSELCGTGPRLRQHKRRERSRNTASDAGKHNPKV